MTIAVLADSEQKEEWLSKQTGEDVEIIWADSVRSLRIIEADAYFDLAFEYDPERIAQLKKLLPRPVFINAVIHTIKELKVPFVRINAWPTMLNRNIKEIVVPGEQQEESIRSVFTAMDWKFIAVPDKVGMVTPVVVSMIINEAWYALEEKISTKEDIDTAMKLGTSYPYGPFEWCEKIGAQRIAQLLTELVRTDARYTVAPSLLQASKS